MPLDRPPEELLFIMMAQMALMLTNVNDQYRSYYPAGSVSRKWWKYLLWFFFNLFIVNSYILEKLAGHEKQSQLAFRRELARLIAG